MLPAEDAEALASALREQINIQKSLEEEKINLAYKHDFNLTDAF